MLLHDPADSYVTMDFDTRDHYRHVIERIAKKSSFSEIEVARASVTLAMNGAELNGQEDRTAHVGFYLIGKGLPQLEHFTKTKHTFSSLCKRTISRFPLIFYLGSIILLTAAFSWSLLEKAQSDGVGSWHIWVLGFLLFLCSSYLSIAIVNWLATILVNPNPLPRLDYSKGIPPNHDPLWLFLPF